MKSIAKHALAVGVFFGLIATGSSGQNSTPPPSEAMILAKDTTAAVALEGQDTTRHDSGRLAQKALQAQLAREIAALERTSLGTGQFSWTHSLHLNLFRAGRQQTQVYWYNPKAKNTPHLWQALSAATDDVFYLDPESGRAVTLDLQSLKGYFIPAGIADKAGFSGNQSKFLAKKSDAWTLEASTDSTQVWTTIDGENRMELTLHAAKDAEQAQAVFQWMCLQPLSSVELPFAAQKFPIQSLERIDKSGTAFRFEVMKWVELDEPLKVDEGELSIKDPERDLRTIAKEWAAQKKAESGEE